MDDAQLLVPPDSIYTLSDGGEIVKGSLGVKKGDKVVYLGKSDRWISPEEPNFLFAKHNDNAQYYIDHMKKNLMAELDLKDDDFIHLPVLFTNCDDTRLIAYTPGVVNSLVLTDADDKGKCNKVRLVMPKPFGPVDSGKCKFEEDIKTKLKGIADVFFVDDFNDYHVASGEIHCGSNSLRIPRSDTWWWEIDWLA